MTDELERQVAAAFLDAYRLVARVRRARPRLDEARWGRVRAAAFEQWRDDVRIQVRLGMDAYLDGVAARQRALTEAMAALAREQATADVMHLPRALTDLTARWPELTKVEQRQLLQAALLWRHGRSRRFDPTRALPRARARGLARRAHRAAAQGARRMDAVAVGLRRHRWGAMGAAPPTRKPRPSDDREQCAAEDHRPLAAVRSATSAAGSDGGVWHGLQEGGWRP